MLLSRGYVPPGELKSSVMMIEMTTMTMTGSRLGSGSPQDEQRQMVMTGVAMKMMIALVVMVVVVVVVVAPLKNDDARCDDGYNSYDDYHDTDLIYICHI